MGVRYAELHCKTNFSFLEGASHADELVTRAAELGYQGLAITDRNSLAGIVRAWGAAKDLRLHLIVGAELHFTDSLPVVVWVKSRAGYARLCRLLTVGRRRGLKGTCELHLSDLGEHAEGLIAGLLPGESAERSQNVQAGRRLRDIFGDETYLLCELSRGPDDAQKLAALQELASESRLRLVAANGVLYHRAERMVAQDCLTAIRLGATIDQIAAVRGPHSLQHLFSLRDLEQSFRQAAELLERSLEISEQCTFSLAELRYEYPTEMAPAGSTPITYLKRLVWEGAKERYPAGVPTTIIETLRKELGLIEELHYESYFLTVWDLVRFARSRHILCQGRGSAANSVVCYCLGVTSVDPEQTELLFERFISRERNEAPDIDVDFEHERREEVLQYLYEKYGRERAGMTATVITYRTKGAIRDVAKALGFSQERTDAMAKLVDGRSGDSDLEARCEQAGLAASSPLGQRFIYLVKTLIGFPRHLSQHTGGMVITQGLLCELCPIENAAMEGRTVIQWDKNDLDELGILKIDCLSLGMLTAIRRCFDLVREHYGQSFTLATIPPDDQATYDMICEADTVGVFQIESRAQMSMLPRLQPRCFYDLVIEVAIVRPGPIQGNMVHPYLQARKNPEGVTYPNEGMRGVLEKTLGVPLFQEQAMRLAVVAAGFTPGEADQLRRAMAAWRRPGVIDQFRIKLMAGMKANGLSVEFAEHVFNQIRGFGEYGFPESHAASFALLVYASAYLKRHFPAAFCAALLNSQPMGFYAPAQLVADARKHGVEVLPPDVNHSQWQCTLEAASGRMEQNFVQLRLGLRLIRGLGERVAQQVCEERLRSGRFRSVEDLTKRVDLDKLSLDRLATADALRSVAGSRRLALWETLAQQTESSAVPLLEPAEGVSESPAPENVLPVQSELEEVYADYGSTGLSLRNHPLAFCREQLNQMRVYRSVSLPQLRHGQHVRVAGLVLMRQRPSTAKGLTFVTLEDETGSMNLILYPDVWKRHYRVARVASAWLASGRLENREGVIHVLVNQLEDLVPLISGFTVKSRDFH